VADREMRIVSIDAGAEALVGWQTSEVRGRRMQEVFEISEAEASVGWTKDQRGFSSAAKELRLRARDGHAVECMAQAVAVRTAEGDTVEILYALRRKPGTRGYEDRVLESIDGLTEIHTVEPPE